MTPTTRIRIIWAILALAIILAGLVAASPQLINSNLVKKQISKQISNWMGLPVTVRGEPVVTVFPYLTVKLKDLQIASNLGPNEPPLVAMDTLRAEMYWLPLLVGNFEVRRFNLINPRFELVRDENGKVSWDMSRGSLLAPAVDNGEDGLRLTDLSLGHFKVSDGRARYRDMQRGHDESIDNIDLSVIWPSTGRAASADGKITWRNEVIAFDAESDKPMELLAGGLSPLSLTVTSKRFTAQLEGSAATMADLQLEGDFRFETPSVRQLSAWLGKDLGTGENLGAAALNARANLVGDSISFAQMTMTLDDNQADGVLQFDFRRDRPLIQGTLAYDQLNATSYLARKDGQESLFKRPFSVKNLGNIDLDIRLSANSLLMEPLRLGRTASTLVVRGKQISFSLGEAYAYGGRLEASLDMRPSKSDPSIFYTQLRAKANGISAGTFAKEFANRPFLTGTALAEIDLRGEGDCIQSTLLAAQGDVSVVITDGGLSHFNLDILQDAVETGDPVEPDAIYEGGSEFDVFSMRGQVTDESLQIDGLRITSGKRALFGAPKVNLAKMELDFPGQLALYRSSDPSTHAKETPEKQMPFHLVGPLAQPILLQGKADKRAGDQEQVTPLAPQVPAPNKADRNKAKSDEKPASDATPDKKPVEAPEQKPATKPNADDIKPEQVIPQLINSTTPVSDAAEKTFGEAAKQALGDKGGFGNNAPLLPPTLTPVSPLSAPQE